LALIANTFIETISYFREAPQLLKIESKNKALLLEGFNALFHKREYDKRYWSANYIENPAEDPPLQ
jgi:hypothetical protein